MDCVCKVIASKYWDRVEDALETKRSKLVNSEWSLDITKSVCRLSAIVIFEYEEAVGKESGSCDLTEFDSESSIPQTSKEILESLTLISNKSSRCRDDDIDSVGFTEGRDDGVGEELSEAMFSGG